MVHHSLQFNFSPTSPNVVSNSDELDPIEESRPGTRVPSNALQKRNKTALHQITIEIRNSFHHSCPRILTFPRSNVNIKVSRQLLFIYCFAVEKFHLEQVQFLYHKNGFSSNNNVIVFQKTAWCCHALQNCDFSRLNVGLQDL